MSEPVALAGERAPNLARLLPAFVTELKARWAEARATVTRSAAPRRRRLAPPPPPPPATAAGATAPGDAPLLYVQAVRRNEAKASVFSATGYERLGGDERRRARRRALRARRAAADGASAQAALLRHVAPITALRLTQGDDEAERARVEGSSSGVPTSIAGGRRLLGLGSKVLLWYRRASEGDAAAIVDVRVVVNAATRRPATKRVQPRRQQRRSDRRVLGRPALRADVKAARRWRTAAAAAAAGRCGGAIVDLGFEKRTRGSAALVFRFRGAGDCDHGGSTRGATTPFPRESWARPLRQPPVPTSHIQGKCAPQERRRFA